MSANNVQNYNSFELDKNPPSGIGEAARFRQQVVAAGVYNAFTGLAPMLPKPESPVNASAPAEQYYPAQASVTPAPAAMPAEQAPAPTILDEEEDMSALGNAARDVIGAIHAETTAERNAQPQEWPHAA